MVLYRMSRVCNILFFNNQDLDDAFSESKCTHFGRCLNWLENVPEQTAS